MLTNLFLLAVLAQTPAVSSTVSGDWQMTWHQRGIFYALMHLEQDGDRVKGSFFNEKLEGTIRNGTLELVMQGDNKAPGSKLSGTLKDGKLAGAGQDEDGPATWSAIRVPVTSAGAGKTHQFVPTEFHNYFSSMIPPALHISPGDTVETKSVDAGGRDENGKSRARGGNPLTGPFYIDGAWPGDTLVVKLNRVRLNRNSAGSGDQIVPSALAPGYFRNQKLDEKFSSEWTLDREHGLARLAKPTEKLKNYTVPLKPMMGCIGVAPPQEQSYRAGFLGTWGGNMDYNHFGEGVTLYLPVYHPGALLFLGDGHAAQGDGELTGDALETSMEFSFTVEVLKGNNAGAPRAENAQYRMASGIANSLPDALQQATTNLARWLADDYKLSANEIAIVLGTAIHYDIAEVVDPYVHVVAKIEKSQLKNLTMVADAPK